MANKKLVQETYSERLNTETGEIENQTSSKVYTFPKEPPYVKLYLEDIEKLYSLPKNSSAALYELLRKLDYDGLINLNSTAKAMICEKIGYKKQSLNNYLSKLVQSDVFRNIGRGVYKPNPHLFGRGEWKEIYKQREAWLKVKYNKDGTRTVESSFDENEEEK